MTGFATRAARSWLLTIEHLTIQRMDHVGIVVDDLAAATEFVVELGRVVASGLAGSKTKSPQVSVNCRFLSRIPSLPS